MKFFFSNQTHGFYLDELHGENMPEDVVELLAGEHKKALDWQAAGGLIAAVASDGSMILKPADGLPGEDE